MAIIAPLIGAGVAALGLGAGAGAIATALVTTALSIGGSLLVGMLTKRKVSASTPSGVEGDVRLGGDQPRQIPFGIVATAGHLVAVNSWGESNTWESEVYVLADVECDGLAGLIVDGHVKVLEPQSPLYGEDGRWHVRNGSDDEGDTDFGAALELRFWRGASDQIADAGLIAAANPSGSWTSDHVGAGVCYVIVTKRYDPALFSGFPSYRFILRGAKVYDLREDSTAGGDGPQRWSDPSTWAFSANPAVCLYTYQRGFPFDGRIDLGQGVPAIDLPSDLFVAAANVCDEAVELAAGGTEPRYAVSLIASDAAEHRETIGALVTAMAGRLYERAGWYAPFAGAAQATSWTITDADLLLDGAVRVTPKRSRAELATHLSGSYTSIADGWEAQGYTPVTAAAAETSLGERLGRSADFSMVTSRTQAERLAAITLGEALAQRSASIQLPLTYPGLEIGDWMRWDSARYGDCTWRVADRRLSLVGGEIGMTLDLEEIAASVYAWDPETDESPAPPVVSRPASAPLTRTVSAFVVQAASTTSPNGEIAPALRVGWSAVTDPTVTAVIVEYRRDGETVASVARSDTPEAGEMEITGLLGGADYEVRATIVTDPPRATSWTSWASVTTTATTVPVVIDTDDMVPSLGRAVEGALIAVKTMQADMLRETLARQDDRKRARSIGASVKTEVIERMTAADGALAARIDTVEASVEAASAAVVSEATARADEDTAIALAVTALDARLDTAEGTIAGQATAISGLSSSVTALDGDVTALASDVTAISATVDDATADGSIRFVAAADQTGALARFELRARTATGGGGTEAEAALVIEAVSAGAEKVSQVKVVADRFIMTGADETTAAPFAVAGGNVFINGSLIIEPGGEILIGDGT